MNRCHRAGRLALLLAVVALLPLSAFAAEEPIDVEYGPDKIEWFPNAAWKVGHLSIAGPGCLGAQIEFRQGERIVFTPYAPSGEPLPDGVYSFDLRLGPGTEVRGLEEPAGEGQLCRGRADLPPLEVLTSTGYVTIVDKRFVDPFREEDPRLTGGAALESGVGAGGGGAAGGVFALGAPAGVDLAGGGLGDEILSTSAAQVINGDLTVRNSLCVGFDCPNVPSFGSDTIRLQENNLRIHFDDTSTTAGFPNRDWRIVVNDSASGGASKFSIEDSTGARTPFTVEAAAPSNSLYVDDGGRVGLGTSTPALELHLRNGDTPSLRLEQDGSSGFAAQTWDVAGNETSFFVRDATNGSTLPFRIQPGAASNRIFLNANDNVGIGTTSPEAPLEVQNAASGLTMQLDAPGDVFFRQRNTTSGQFVDVNLIGDEFRLNFGTGGPGPELVLQSDGDLIITGGYTPDYVFEPDYPLMPLDELGAFIDENKHLPNVPSDAEVKATRQVNVNEFQMRLLEKIEELTLYTLQQQETIGRQEEVIGRLEERLVRLESAASPE